MNNKKSVLVFALIVVLVGISGIVSAGLFGDVWGKITGRQIEPVPVGVNITSVPLPEIIYVSDPLVNQINNNVDVPTNYTFIFTASSVSASNLPGSVGVPDVTFPWATDADAGVRGNFTATGEAVRGVETCWYISGQDTPTTKNYSCNVSMWYFDDPLTWLITVEILDIYGGSGINDTQDFPLAYANYFDINPNSLNWSSVGVSVLDQKSDNNITIINRGNRDLGPTQLLQINGSVNLSGTVDVDQYISVGNFSVAAPPQSCDVADRTNLLLSTYQTVTYFFINHDTSTAGSPASNETEYCIPELTGILSAQYYNSSIPWIINVAYS